MPRPDPDRPNRPPKTHTRPKTDHKEKVTPRGTPERRSKQASPRTPDRRSNQRASKHTSASTTERSSNALSLNALAKLDALNEKDTVREKERVADRRAKEKVVTGRVLKERGKYRRRSGGQGHGGKRRVVSGPLAEEGKVMHRRGGYGSKDGGKRRFGKKFWWIVLISVAILIIIIAVVAVMVGKKGKGEAGNGGGSDSGADPANSNLAEISESDIPTAAKGSYFDPFTWYDTTDFNVTYTNETVGGLPVMGLNSTWDDSTQANKNVPALDKEWAYGTMPIRGVNLGGWLSIEPFITPSFFNSYKENENIVDEWTLTSKLGPSQSAKMLEKHYALFVNAQTFKDIQDAGFDHIRIPFSYWAVKTYPGDPYVAKISWRYLLRAIEYARACGLRVNLDLHAVPGSQNGWNHSGRSGDIGWLNGTDGSLNGQRSLDIHDQLSTFFAQPRYAKVVAIYGLVNEPKMIALPTQTVIDWTTKAVGVVRKNGIKQNIAIGDGFLGLPKWQGKLEGVNGLILDSHPYTIFDPNLIVFPHQKKIQFACTSWSSQMEASMNTASGYVFSPFLSQAYAGQLTFPQLWTYNDWRMVASRHRLRPLPQQCQDW